MSNEKFKKGDWVVLGDSGRGWPPKYKGQVVQIADIGPHLIGKLHLGTYDFYAYPNGVITKDDQIAKSDGGGLSNNIERLYRRPTKNIADLISKL